MDNTENTKKAFLSGHDLMMDETLLEWKASGKTRMLFVAVNMPGYYSLPVRILPLFLSKNSKLADQFEFKFIEFENTAPVSHLFEIVNKISPDILGLSVNIWNRDICFELAELLKQANPKLKCIAGGQEVTNSVIDYLQCYPQIDYIVDGEGEMPLAEFLSNWNPETCDIDSPESISGLRYRKDNISAFSGPAAPVRQLDDIPSPILAGLIDPTINYKLGIMVEGTRGCPFKCSFCFEGGEKRRVRTASIERIRSEVEYMASKGAKYFHIMDPILCNSNLERLQQIAGLFDEMNQKYKNIVVSVEAYAHHITLDIARCMKSFRLIDIGLQTVNPETAKAIHRPWQPEKFQNGLDCLRQAKAPFTIYLICGLPHETFETFINGMRQVIEEKPAKLFFNELLLLNGTELRQRASEYGYVFDDAPPYQVRSNRWMSEKHFQLANLIAKDVEKRYNLSARAVHTSAPWIPEEAAPDQKPVTMYPQTRCSQACDGCSRRYKEPAAFMDKTVQSLLSQVENQDIEVVLGDQFEKNDLIKLVGQLVLAGSARIKLTAPARVFSDRDFVKWLVERGVWHFKTVLPASRLQDSGERVKAAQQILSELMHFNPPVDLVGYASIFPHFELVVLYDENTESDEYFQLLSQAALPYVSVITLPQNSLRFENFQNKNTLDTLIEKGVQTNTFYKLPHKVWRTYFEEQQMDARVTDHLDMLGMISHDPNQLPCFKPA